MRDESGLETAEIPTSVLGTRLTYLGGDLAGLVVVVGAFLFAANRFDIKIALDAGSSLAWLVPVVLLSFAAAGLYQQRFAHPAIEMQKVALVTGIVAWSVALNVYLVTGSTALSALLGATGVLAAILLPLCRAFVRILCSRLSWWGVPAAVITANGSGAGILRTLTRWPEIGLRPVAILGDPPPRYALNAEIRGPAELAPRVAQQLDVPYAILAMPSLSREERANVHLRYAKHFDHVVVLEPEEHLPALWTTTHSGDGLSGYSVRHSSLRPGARFAKRTLDLIVATLMSVLALPVFAVIATLIRRGSPGPVFFRQRRMGEEGRIITVLKFRTMYEDAHERLEEILAENEDLRREYEQYHKLEDDPRVTPTGEFLRRYSLDELPQLFNVLRGDMSLVGPRAYIPGELPKMERLARAVLQAPPGLTGLWQVSGRNNLSFAERVELDVHYIQNWSVWLDLYLLVRTLPTIITGEGAS